MLFTKIIFIFVIITIIVSPNNLAKMNYQNVETQDTTARNKNKFQGELRQNQQVIPPSNKTDAEFFASLNHYWTLPCYNGRGAPLFLFNSGWYLSLGCILILNAIFLMVIFIQLQGAGQGYRPVAPEKIRIYTIVNIVILALIDITYFMTQFMNPGIRNLATISSSQHKEEGEIFCIRCNGNRTRKMEHCRDCQVCIENLDHHCGFFSKCIGGYQQYFFFAFIALIGIGFIFLIVTMVTITGL